MAPHFYHQRSDGSSFSSYYGAHDPRFGRGMRHKMPRFSAELAVFAFTGQTSGTLMLQTASSASITDQPWRGVNSVSHVLLQCFGFGALSVLGHNGYYQSHQKGFKQFKTITKVSKCTDKAKRQQLDAAPCDSNASCWHSCHLTVAPQRLQIVARTPSVERSQRLELCFTWSFLERGGYP